MSRKKQLLNNIDWLSVFLYLILMVMGWISIYAAVYSEEHSSILDVTQSYGKQLIWMGGALILGVFILLIDSKFFTSFSLVIYVLVMLLLLGVLLFGTEAKGAKSWFEIGSVRIQPSEFGKFATCLAVAYVMSREGFKMMRLSSILTVGTLLLIPILLILMQPDAGSALVYSSFILVMYREGLHGSLLLLCFIGVVILIFTLLYPPLFVYSLIIGGSLIAFLYYRKNSRECFQIFLFIITSFLFLWFLKWLLDWETALAHLMLFSYFLGCLFGMYFIYKRKIRYVLWIILAAWLCIGATISVGHVFEKLPIHQKERINNLLGIENDLSNAGYNVYQSKVAIGSGGFSGKGFLEGTQTKYNFVPEQSTDFIFCTVGEEWGFLGTSTVLLLWTCFILRLIYLAERQRSSFSRIYGYGVASILFFHLVVNIGMTIGLAPVIGIPLPLFSYGGSSLWSFTILIFIFLRFDANRLQVFR